MLVPAATERVIDDVHRNTADTWPVGCSVLHLVVFVAGFYERFLDATTTGNNADGCTASCVEPFRLAAGHTDTDTVF